MEFGLGVFAEEFVVYGCLAYMYMGVNPGAVPGCSLYNIYVLKKKKKILVP